MPKLRMTDQQRREKALMRALEKAKFENLKKDGTYKLQPFDRDDALPEALLTLHSALKKKARKRNA